MRPTGSIRITIPDDHPIFRLGVRTLLSLQEGFAVIGEAGDTDTAVEVVTSLRPDVLLIDHNLPRLNGLEVVRRIHTARTGTRSIVLTAAMSEPDIQHAL